jgi:hypothetical protein
MDWICGSSGRAPALQSSKFKPQSHHPPPKKNPNEVNSHIFIIKLSTETFTILIKERRAKEQKKKGRQSRMRNTEHSSAVGTVKGQF